MSGFHTLDQDNALINGVYDNPESNYIIVDHEVDNRLCYVYCSSNDIYKKDSEADFREKIVESDRYEWQNRSSEIVPAREVFIRDIWLSWYARGLNLRTSSIDAIIAWLRSVTEGYVVRTVGVSSGGYVAAILAVSLNAQCCLDFSGQFSLSHHFDHMQVNPFLRTQNKYAEAYHLIRDSHVPIFYFLPVYSAQDIEQSFYAMQCQSVRVIRCKSKKHSVPLYSVCLPSLLSWDVETLEALAVQSSRQPIGRLPFAVKVAGVRKTAQFCLRKAHALLLRRS